VKARKKEDEGSGRREATDVVIRALMSGKGKLRRKECLEVNAT